MCPLFISKHSHLHLTNFPHPQMIFGCFVAILETKWTMMFLQRHFQNIHPSTWLGWVTPYIAWQAFRFFIIIPFCCFKMTVNNGRLLLQVIRDKWTGKTRGYGFVSFANASDLAAALKEMNGISSCPHSLSPFAWIIVALQIWLIHLTSCR